MYIRCSHWCCEDHKVHATPLWQVLLGVLRPPIVYSSCQTTLYCIICFANVTWCTLFCNFTVILNISSKKIYIRCTSELLRVQSDTLYQIKWLLWCHINDSFANNGLHWVNCYFWYQESIKVKPDSQERSPILWSVYILRFYILSIYIMQLHIKWAIKLDIGHISPLCNTYHSGKIKSPISFIVHWIPFMSCCHTISALNTMPDSRSVKGIVQVISPYIVFSIIKLLLYKYMWKNTDILKVNLIAFAYRLFHGHFSPLDVMWRNYYVEYQYHLWTLFCIPLQACLYQLYPTVLKSCCPYTVRQCNWLHWIIYSIKSQDELTTLFVCNLYYYMSLWRGKRFPLCCVS